MNAPRLETSHDPAWRQEFAEAYRLAPADLAAAAKCAGLEAETAGFLSVLAPLIQRGRQRLESRLARMLGSRPAEPLDRAGMGDRIVDVMFRELPPLLLGMMARTMVLELHVARLQGELHADTSAGRYVSFLELLRDRERAVQLLREYPVLTRQLVLAIRHWAQFSAEFLQHLCDDYRDIAALLNGGRDAGRLVGVQFGAGDRHRQGRSVVLAEFSSGLRTVYKPKSLAVDVHFQELLKWLNRRGAEPQLRTLRVLDRGDHGWVEFVAAEPCRSEHETARFYRRQGACLALLHALSGTDFHCDNVIASGEHPVLVDLEALFHRTPSSGCSDQLLAESVLATGLLPESTFDTGEEGGRLDVDISGLGGFAGQQLPYETPHCENDGTDEMRVTRRRAELPPALNLPRTDESPLGPQHHRSTVAAGFAAMYQLLLDHRDELLSESLSDGPLSDGPLSDGPLSDGSLRNGGPLARFAEDEVRFIARPTRSYAVLLQEKFHPDRLRDEAAHDRWLDRLWDAVPRQPHLARLVAAEKADLSGCDIPLFTTRPGARDLFSSRNEPIADFFEETGLQRVARRLRSLGPADLDRQLWVIDASLSAWPRAGSAHSASARARATDAHTDDPLRRPIRPREADRSDLLSAAAAIGDRLESLAWRRGDQATWLGLQADGARWKVSAMGPDLYDGLAGVTLFLAHLGAHMGERRYGDLSRDALRSLQHQIQTDPHSVTSVGAYSGWGGVVHVLTQLGVLWDDLQLLRDAEQLASRLQPWVDRDEYSDVIDGSAGCLASLLRLHRRRPSSRTFRMAVRCGERLLARSVRLEHGMAWLAPAAAQRPLVGFAHGTAGIRWSLLELFQQTGENRFRQAAAETLVYERSASCGATNTTDASWCHGAAGRALSLLRSLECLQDDSRLNVEINAALHCLTAAPPADNHSLCHGEGGTIDVLLEAAAALDAPGLKNEAAARARRLASRVRRGDWRCATPSSIDTPGIMTGLAGIGYTLLRAAAPDRVPSILAL